jgi:hypothetical protein
MLLMLARWYHADIICSHPRWIVLSEFLKSVSIDVSNGHVASGKRQLASLTTSPRFPQCSEEKLTAPQQDRLQADFSYRIISMTDPNANKKFASKSWKENLADVFGARRATLVVAVVGLVAFGVGVYTHADAVLSWLRWAISKIT